MEDRFNFAAQITGYYGDGNGEFIEVPIILKDVSLCSGGDIVGFESYRAEEAIKEQYPKLDIKQVKEVLMSLEDNSQTNDNSYDFLAVKPDKILQCTGFKNSEGILIYEGDSYYLNRDKCIVKFYNGKFMLYNTRSLKCSELTQEISRNLY